jgi:hypothetical protein
VGDSGERRGARVPDAALWSAAGLLVFLAALRLASSSPIDSDGASNVLQGADLLHGNLLLAHWHVSDVSFYLTDLPLYAVLTLIFGTAPAVVHVGAAIVFTAVVLLTVLLAGHGWRGAAPAGAIVFTAPVDPAGIQLFLSSPNHISTVAMALLVLLIMERRVGVLFTVVAAVAELSDPMAIFVLAVPVLAVSALRASRRLDVRQADVRLFLCTAGSVALAKLAELLIKAAGGFDAYPPAARFAPAARLGTDLTITYRQLLRLFGADYTGHRPAPHLVTPLLHLLGLALVVIAVVITIRRFFEVDRLDQILAAAIVINLAEFALTSQARTTQSARSFLVVLAFGAVLAARRLPGPLERLRLVPMVSAVLAGCVLLTLVPLRHGPRDVARVGGQQGQDNAALVSWLTANHLTYGLGSYWNASGVTVQSRDRVKVRPVQPHDGRIAVMDTEFDRRWYDPGRHSATFLIVANDRPQLKKIAITAYGPPVRTTSIATSTILVWNRNLLPVAPSRRDT